MLHLQNLCRLGWLLAIVLLASSARAQSKPQVVLLGTFHFNNPGRDVVKSKVDDVLSEKRQAEIRDLVADLQAFKPDVIFIEAEPTQQPHIDSLYASYLAGGLRERRNEIMQVGFRLGQALGLKPTQLLCVDASADFPYDSVMRVATQAGQTQLLASFAADTKRREQEFNQLLASSTIKEVLRHLNTPAYQKDDLGFYTNTLTLAGGTGNNVGAYTTAQWYTRNVLIHGNILKRLTGREKRILVLFGAGHVSVLDPLMRLNPAYEVVPVSSVLRPQKRK